MNDIACAWPRLATMGLTASALADRRRGIGGSDANIILSGDPERLMALWREKRGEAPEGRLEHVLPVMLGQWTEAFNRQWYERATGFPVSNVGSVWTSGEHAWRRATLDGLIEEKRAVWEAKHVSAFAKSEEVLARYMPQLQHNMVVAGLENAVLSVIFGNQKWETYEIAADWLYQDELFAAELQFWRAVESGDPPIVAAPPTAPKPIHYREVCLDGNNRWASAAADWIVHETAAKRFAGAVKSLKELIPDDVARAFGHGLEAKRSKSGALSIREMAR